MEIIRGHQPQGHCSTGPQDSMFELRLDHVRDQSRLIVRLILLGETGTFVYDESLRANNV